MGFVKLQHFLNHATTNFISIWKISVTQGMNFMSTTSMIACPRVSRGYGKVFQSTESFPSPQKSNCDNTFHALYFIDENIKTPGTHKLLWIMRHVKWGASSWWSKSLCCPTRKSDEMAIRKASPTLIYRQYNLPWSNLFLEKRSTKELQNTPPIDASSFCKSAYFINNGTKVVGIFENEICRFDLEVSQCSLK